MKKTKIQIPEGFPMPLNKSVWILEAKAHETKTAAGLIIPQSVQTGSERDTVSGVGFIYAIGPLVDIKYTDKDGKMRSLEVGNKVMYNLYENRGISVGGYFYVQMHESSLQSVLPDEDVLVMKGPRINRKRSAVQKKESEIGGKGSQEIIGMTK